MNFNVIFNMVLIVWCVFLISQIKKEDMIKRSVKIFVSVLFLIISIANLSIFFR